MRPLIPAISVTENISLNPIADGVVLQNDLMSAYLSDSYENVAEYAQGGVDNDDPKSVEFSWSADDEYDSFTLRISENVDMSDAREIVTDKNVCDVYNLNRS